MPNVRGVVNHIKYMRSNWTVVAGSFMLLLAGFVVVGSLGKAGSDALAAGYYGSSYNSGYSSNYNTGYNSGYNYYPSQYSGGSYYSTPSNYYNNNSYKNNYNYSNYNNNNNYNQNRYTTTTYSHPRYSCNSLSAVKVSDKAVRFTTSASASGGASIVGYRYDYGDGVVQNGGSSVTHTYPRSGTFTARAWAKVSVRGQQVWTNACSRTVTVHQSYPTPTPCPYNSYGNRHCSPQPTHTPYPPQYSCNHLSATKISDRQYRLTTSANARYGAQIISYRYDYGDGIVQDGGRTVNHTYPRTGTFQARSWALVRVNGQNRWTNACTTTVHVTGSYPTPHDRYACNILSATKIGDRQYRFTTVAAATGNAQIISYRYDYGDGIVQDGGRTVNHTYPRTGTFQARSWALVRVNGQNRWTNACTTTVHVTHQSPSPSPTHSPCPHDYCAVPAHSSSDSDSNSSATATAKATANVTVVPATSTTIVDQGSAPNVTYAAKTATAPETTGDVTELPQTGSENMIVNSIGLGGMVLASSLYAASRRELLNAFMKR